ncbi:Hypothetical predicted protein [Paramuricea clavata]|uniref:Uncharacterized protein n=1 Tax=Paramuricea clavata TaxID=317549 RepID=A0A7D9DLW4_PARCT|nr:Hypothetical predicted protein [Paramuricea clavata]
MLDVLKAISRFSLFSQTRSIPFPAVQSSLEKCVDRLKLLKQDTSRGAEWQKYVKGDYNHVLTQCAISGQEHLSEATKCRSREGGFSQLDVVKTDKRSHLQQSPLEDQTKVRKLSWESRELRWAKRKLDKNHLDSLPGLSKLVMILRQQGEPSTKPKPANCPDWACIVPTNPADAAGPGDDNATAVDLNVSW